MATEAAGSLLVASGETNVMMGHHWTALVTLLALLVHFGMSLQAGRAHLP